MEQGGKDRSMTRQLLISLGLTSCLFGALPLTASGQDLTNQDRSIDIELYRPTFSRDSILGVDSPVIGGESEFQAGFVLQYEKAPLRLVERDTVRGLIVNNRQVLQLGLSYAPSKRFAARMMIPIAAHWGNEIPEWSGDGAGVGDMQAGVLNPGR